MIACDIHAADDMVSDISVSKKLLSVLLFLLPLCNLKLLYVCFLIMIVSIRCLLQYVPVWLTRELHSLSKLDVYSTALLRLHEITESTALLRLHEITVHNCCESCVRYYHPYLVLVF